MPRIIISEMTVTGPKSGVRQQKVKVRQTDYQGNKVTRECQIPIETGQEPYALGVYELSERSFYVDRSSGQLKLYPRLHWVRQLKSEQELIDQVFPDKAPQSLPDLHMVG